MAFFYSFTELFDCYWTFWVLYDSLKISLDSFQSFSNFYGIYVNLLGIFMISFDVYEFSF